MATGSAVHPAPLPIEPDYPTNARQECSEMLDGSNNPSNLFSDT